MIFNVRDTSSFFSASAWPWMTISGLHYCNNPLIICSPRVTEVVFIIATIFLHRWSQLTVLVAWSMPWYRSPVTNLLHPITLTITWTCYWFDLFSPWSPSVHASRSLG
jgi:hypothetical protein